MPNCRKMLQCDFLISYLGQQVTEQEINEVMSSVYSRCPMYQSLHISLHCFHITMACSEEWWCISWVKETGYWNCKAGQSDRRGMVTERDHGSIGLSSWCVAAKEHINTSYSMSDMINLPNLAVNILFDYVHIWQEQWAELFNFLPEMCNVIMYVMPLVKCMLSTDKMKKKVVQILMKHKWGFEGWGKLLFFQSYWCCSH